MTYLEWMQSKNIAAYGSHLEPIIKLAYEAGFEAAQFDDSMHSRALAAEEQVKLLGLQLRAVVSGLEHRALTAEEKIARARIDAQLIEALALAKLAQEQSRKRSEAFAAFDVRNNMPGPWPHPAISKTDNSKTEESPTAAEVAEVTALMPWGKSKT